MTNKLDFAEIVFQFLVKIIPDDWVITLNDESLKELEKRGLIIWTGKAQSKMDQQGKDKT